MSLAKDSSVTGGKLRGRTGPLVRYPLDGVAFRQSGATFNKGSALSNADGTANQASISVAAFTGTTSFGMWRQRIQGTTVGWRYRAEDGTTTMATVADAIIDGICYPQEELPIKFDNLLGLSGGTYQDEQRIIAENLPDGDHTVSIIVVGNTDGVTTRTLVLYGFLADSTRGHPNPAPQGRNISLGSASTQIPTSATAIPFATNGAAGLTFYNGDAGSHTITVYGTDGTSVHTVVTLAAGATSNVVFPGGPRSLSGWKWKVDSGTLTTGWVENVT